MARWHSNRDVGIRHQKEYQKMDFVADSRERLQSRAGNAQSLWPWNAPQLRRCGAGGHSCAANPLRPVATRSVGGVLANSVDLTYPGERLRLLLEFSDN